MGQKAQVCSLTPVCVAKCSCGGGNDEMIIVQEQQQQQLSTHLQVTLHLERFTADITRVLGFT